VAADEAREVRAREELEQAVTDWRPFTEAKP
jgi:hypothetical protein